MISRTPNGDPEQAVLHQKSAFTLIELMVTVALLGLLALVFTPALAKTRNNSKATQCLNNLRQFTAGWTMYSSDNQERVPDNYGVADTLNTIQSGALSGWANNVMSWTTGTSIDNQSNTNIAWVANSVLGKYLADPVRIYHCPADIYLSQRQIAAGYQGRVRSISMSSFFGRYSPGNDITASGHNFFFPQYGQYLKRTSILKPAKTWLVLDEHPDSINDGLFVNDPAATGWGDIPASYHNGACGVAFTDGHSELRRWQSRTSIYPVRFFYSSTPFDQLGKQDFAWYLEHTGYINANTGAAAFNY